MSTDTTTKKKALKPLEVGVGAGAAVITAFASSYLGTAGTLTGAALASVVGTVSTSVLRSSAETSAERLRRSTVRLRDLTARTETHPADPVDPYGEQLFGAPDLGGSTAAGAHPGSGAGGIPRDPGRPRWVVLAAGAVVAFVAAVVMITGIESAAGKPLAGLVGNESGGGTTIGRATGSDSSTEERPAGTTTTPTPTATPSAGPTDEPGATATPTETSPTAEATGGPSLTTAAPTPTVPAPSAAPTP